MNQETPILKFLPTTVAVVGLSAWVGALTILLQQFGAPLAISFSAPVAILAVHTTERTSRYVNSQAVP
jgi:hypothetical protein